MPFTVAEIAKHLGGEIAGDPAVELTGFAPADRAQRGDLTFAENESYFTQAEQGAASAVIVDEPFTSIRMVLIRVPNARVAFANVLPLFFPEPVFCPGIHPSTLIAASSAVHPTAHIGAFCVIGENCSIGARTVLQGGNFVGDNCRLGEDDNIFPCVTLYPSTEIGQRVRIHAGTVIGSDGFGYVQDGPMHRKVPQIGNVIIRDEVEIGANVTVDRGALGPTIIGRGSKIDNLVQIGHNVVIGENCLVVAQAGIAGSTKLGSYVVLGGQSGLAGHLEIGNHVSIAAQSGVMTNVPDGEKWLWTPARKDRMAKRQIIALQQLPDLLRRVAELEKKLDTESGPG